jgi:hypothetical protein
MLGIISYAQVLLLLYLTSLMRKTFMGGSNQLHHGPHLISFAHAFTHKIKLKCTPNQNKHYQFNYHLNNCSLGIPHCKEIKSFEHVTIHIQHETICMSFSIFCHTKI